MLYGSLDGLIMRHGERVRWYLIGLGNETDIYTGHWHGNTALRQGSRIDTVKLFAATTEVVDMRPDKVGGLVIPLPCHRPLAGGMVTRLSSGWPVGGPAERRQRLRRTQSLGMKS
jgi:hypothetical protein